MESLKSLQEKHTHETFTRACLRAPRIDNEFPQEYPHQLDVNTLHARERVGSELMVAPALLECITIHAADTTGSPRASIL